MDLDNLDRALHDLGMLSAVTEARREYLRETKSDSYLMRINSRYVTDVTIGYCMKRAPNKQRVCPYILPVRHRTKSENSDTLDNSNTNNVKIIETSNDNISQAKRCLSLENLNLFENSSKLEILKELDGVSIQIQKLQVDE